VEDRQRDEQTSEGQAPQSMNAPETQQRTTIGQPGIASASGRDRSQGELPASFGTDQGSLDLSGVAPPPGAVEGTRVGEAGDPTGTEEPGQGSGSGSGSSSSSSGAAEASDRS
jgi:hypothetical protein